MEIPTARILEDGEMRIGVAQADPYRWYGVGMGLLPGLECDFRLTQLMGVESGMPGYGDCKDKAFDIKYQILPESKFVPAIAIGLQDFHGTRLFSAKYLTLSRQIFPFDFTLGIGEDRLKGSTTLFKDYGLFGGIEVALTDKIRFMVEYNPIEYEKEKGAAGKAIKEPVRHKFNYGARVKILPGTDFTLSYQRGDTLGFMCNLQFELGRPLRPWKPDWPRLVPVDQRPFRERKLEDIVKAIQRDVYEQGFSNVRAYADGRDLVVEFENTRYLSDQKAVGRVLRIALAHAPEDASHLVIISKKLNIPITRFSVEPALLADYLGGRIREDMFKKLIKVEFIKHSVPKESMPAYARTDNQPGERFSYAIKPGVETHLNDPSGFFKCRLSANPWLRTRLWDGADAYVRYKIPFYTDISTANIPPPDAVRSDIVDYKDSDATFDRLILDQVIHLTDRSFGRVSIGYFELMYAGISAELLTFLGDGRIAVGVEGNWVRKREPESVLAVKDFKAHTCLGNLYYTIPGLDLTLNVQYGKYLAGDRGWMLEASRTYSSGVTMGGWYSFTDTSAVSGWFNKDYHEKGVFLSLPTRMFKDRDSTRRYTYAISPWTRDVAQNVGKWRTLFSLTRDLMPARFKASTEKLRE